MRMNKTSMDFTHLESNQSNASVSQSIISLAPSTTSSASSIPQDLNDIPPPRSIWTPSQDDKLSIIVNQIEQETNEPVRNWTKVSKTLLELHNIDRSAKQCRERWHNHVSPNVNKGPWTDEEITILYEGIKTHGQSWSAIAALLPGRTDNSIKNKYYCEVRKKQNQKNNSSSTTLPLSIAQQPQQPFVHLPEQTPRSNTYIEPSTPSGPHYTHPSSKKVKMHHLSLHQQLPNFALSSFSQDGNLLPPYSPIETNDMKVNVITGTNNADRNPSKRERDTNGLDYVLSAFPTTTTKNDDERFLFSDQLQAYTTLPAPGILNVNSYYNVNSNFCEITPVPGAHQSQSGLLDDKAIFNSQGIHRSYAIDQNSLAMSMASLFDQKFSFGVLDDVAPEELIDNDMWNVPFP